MSGQMIRAHKLLRQKLAKLGHFIRLTRNNIVPRMTFDDLISSKACKIIHVIASKL